MITGNLNVLDERDHILRDENDILIPPIVRSTRRKNRNTYHFHSNKNPDQSYISEESAIEYTDHDASQFVLQENVTNLIRITRPFRIRWDLLTMLLALYNCLTVPFFVAFYPEENISFFILNTTIDVVFIVDIFLNFYTTYIDRNGDEVINHKKIVLHYLKGFFWLDLIASVPIDNFYVMLSQAQDDSNFIQLSDLLKLVRILRLGRIIRFTRTRDDMKAAMKLLQLTLYLVMWVHLTGCIWFLLIKDDKEWIPVPDFGDGFTNLYTADIWTQYFTCFYHAVWLLTGGEVGPKNSLQAFVASLLIIIGALITAVLFGEMAVLMSNLNRRQTQFQEILDGALTTMNNMKLPEKLTNKILDYITSTQSSLSQQEEYETFQRHISPSLQQEVSACIYDPIIRMNYVLQNEEKLTNELVLRLHNRFCKPEEEIVVEGTKADTLYFLVNGECKVFVNDENRVKAPVCFLYPGSHFGEIGVVYNTLRTATVVGIGYCTVAELNKKDYEALTSYSPNLANKFRRCTEVYHDPWKTYLLEILSQEKYFNSLPPQVFNELVYFMGIRKVERGHYLYKPGDPANCIYLVTEGEFELNLTINERHLHLLKQKAKMPDIEKPPLLPKKNTTLYDYKDFYMFDIFKAEGLKAKADLVPLFNSKGVVGSLRLDDEVPPNLQTVGDYPQEIVVEYLRPGTIVHSSYLLLKDSHHLQCKAVKNSVAYALSIDRLDILCKEHPEFKKKINRRKSSLQASSANKLVDLLDFSYRDLDNVKYRWKKSIVKVLLNQREERKRGSSRLANMVTKIQAIIACEEAGNFDLAEKVLKGQIPPHYIMEDGSLDPAASKNDWNETLPRTHPVIKAFKGIFDSITQPGGSIIKQYNAIEKSLHVQNNKVKEIDKQMSDLKNKMLTLIQKISAKKKMHGQLSVKHELEELINLNQSQG